MIGRKRLRHPVALVMVMGVAVVVLVMLMRIGVEEMYSDSSNDVPDAKVERDMNPSDSKDAPEFKAASDLKWWQKTIVYQIYPRSFKDSDGDGTGDLKGITSKLDYLAYLNVGAIWISPFYTSPMADFGYDVSDYFNVDPIFGNLADFDKLVQQAHSRGIRVIVDLVASHTSSAHPWFNLSAHRARPYDDYYIWTDGIRLENGTVLPPSNWVSKFGFSAWTWVEERQQFYFHKYLQSQPTLNYRNHNVRDEMKSVLRFWLERGVDGFRADAVSALMVHQDYYQDQARSHKEGFEPWQYKYYINNLTQNVPDIFPVIAEWREVIDAYDNSDDDTDNSKLLIVEAVGDSADRRRFIAHGADMPFNFDLMNTVGDRRHRFCDAICIRDSIQGEYDSLPEGIWANFVFSCHDKRRASTRLGSLYVDAMNMLLLTLRGTPTTYYGEELGMQDIEVSFQDTQDPYGKNYGPTLYKIASRDPERSPMQWDDSVNAGFTSAAKPWLPVHPHYSKINVKRQMESPETTPLRVYRDLAVLRGKPSMQGGEITFAVVTPSILSYIRSANGHPAYLVVLNFGREAETHDLSKPAIGQVEGRVKVVTSNAANEERFVTGQVVALNSVELVPGDGVVIEVRNKQIK